MTRRFALLVDDATKDQQDAVTNWLRTTKLGFWHYLSHLWLIVDHRDEQTATTLRDKLREVVPGKTTLVLVVEDPNGWAAFGPTDSFKWLHDGWKSRPEG